MKIDYQMKVCELEEALRLSDIRKGYLEDQLEQARQCLSFKESAKLIAENMKLRDCARLVLDDYEPRKLTYGWHDVLVNKIRKILIEVDNERQINNAI